MRSRPMAAWVLTSVVLGGCKQRAHRAVLDQNEVGDAPSHVYFSSEDVKVYDEVPSGTPPEKVQYYGLEDVLKKHTSASKHLALVGGPPGEVATSERSRVEEPIVEGPKKLTDSEIAGIVTSFFVAAVIGGISLSYVIRNRQYQASVAKQQQPQLATTPSPGEGLGIAAAPDGLSDAVIKALRSPTKKAVFVTAQGVAVVDAASH